MPMIAGADGEMIAGHLLCRPALREANASRFLRGGLINEAFADCDFPELVPDERHTDLGSRGWGRRGRRSLCQLQLIELSQDRLDGGPVGERLPDVGESNVPLMIQNIGRWLREVFADSQKINGFQTKVDDQRKRQLAIGWSLIEQVHPFQKHPPPRSLLSIVQGVDHDNFGIPLLELRILRDQTGCLRRAVGQTARKSPA